MQHAITFLRLSYQTFICTIFIAFFLLVLLQVIFRYSIGYSLGWSEELARFLFVWAVYIGGIETIRRGMNIAVDIAVEFMSPPVAFVFFTIQCLIISVFLAIVFVLGIEIALGNMRQVSSMLRIPMGYIYLAIPIGAGGMFIMQVVTWYNRALARR